MSISRFAVVALAATVLPLAAEAQVVKKQDSTLDRLVFVDQRLHPEKRLVAMDEVADLVDADVAREWERFKTESGNRWNARVDYRNGRLALAEGSGIPWVPGKGNGLVTSDVAAHLRGRGKPDMVAMEALARGFIPRVAALLGVNPTWLVLNQGRSTKLGDYVWIVDFDIHAKGVPIEGAHVVFRVNNGNLTQFGGEKTPRRGVKVPKFKLARDQARDVLLDYIGGFDGSVDTWVNQGSQHMVTAAEIGEAGPGHAFGRGYGLLSVWDFVFVRSGVIGLWRARVDAVSGELLMFVDDLKYSSVTGGVYPVSFIFNDEAILAMPFADLSTGGYSNSAGLYSWDGISTVTSTLNGQYVQISDGCGAISMDSDAVTGDISFSMSSGIDCATPGVGGAGNTHAARMQFYHVNRAKEKGRAWLPSVLWLQGQNLVNVNGSPWCNATSSGSTLNFYQSDTGCANLGELAGVSLHELAHSLDTNDGNGFSPDNGTGETYADFTAVLQTHNSCVGNGAFLGSNCGGYGDPCTSCDGVRDIDWARHSSNTPHTALDLASSTGFDCPPDGSYYGPCGTEGHCESYIASEALWDFVARDLPNPGTAEAWAIADRLWYLSRPTAGAAYTCNSSTFATAGCDNSNYFKVMKFFDDDDGDLSNGTPHAGDLFAAFDRHLIACGLSTDPENQNHTGCTPPSAPVINATGADNQAILNWTDVGGGAVYDVWRNELGCSSGFTRVANDVALTTFTDTAVANGYTYYYQVTAQPVGNEACSSVPSNCASVVPVPCTPPAAPAGSVTAANNGDNRIDVGWNAVVGATDYHIYRMADYESVYTQVGSVADPTLSFSDTTVSGGTGYTYVVRAFLDCESPNSAASPEVVATGICLLPPAFAGATSASSAGTATCGITVAWDAGTPNCGSALSYAVYRSEDPVFVAGAGNLLVSGLSGLSYTDSDGLVEGTTYYYIVRATDTTSATSDANSVRVASEPYGPTTTQQVYLDDFDGSRPTDFNDYWNHATFTNDDNGATELALNTSRSYSPTTSYKFGGSGTGDYTAREDNALSLGGDGTGPSGANGFAIPVGATNMKLRFRQTYEFQANADGAMLYYSTTSWGSNLVQVGTAPSGTEPYIESGGYTGNIGIPAWTGSNLGTWQEVVVNADGVAGQTVWFLWRFYSDLSTNAEGYYLDDVQISGDLPGPCTTGSSCTDPAAATNVAAVDVDGCAPSGVQITFTPSPDASRHDLVVDGAVVVTDISSGHVYVPGDTAPRSYAVRAVDSSCFTDSTTVAGVADAANAPTAPVITVSDDDDCAQSGVRISFTTDPSVDRYDLLVDGLTTVSPYASGALYVPGDGADHSYVVRAVEGACTTDSAAQVFADSSACLCLTPPSFTGLSTVSAVTGATTCALRLEWPQASSTCPSGPTVVYTVYRSTTPGFTPDPATNLVASCLTGTSWEDTSAAIDTTFYYVVRAEDSTFDGGGPCNGGNQDGNTVEVSGVVASTTEAATQSGTLTATDASPIVSTTLTPSLGVVTATSATLSFSVSFAPAGGSGGTLSYDLGGTPLVVPASTTTTFSQTVTEAEAVSGVTTTVNLTPPSRRSGASDDLTVSLVHSGSGLSEVLYNGSRSGWSSQTFGPFATFDGEAADTRWDLVIVHASGGSNPNQGSLTAWNLAIDFSGSGAGNTTDNARVVLIDPSATRTVVKDYTAAAAASYDVTALYTGPGDYQLELAKDLTGSADLSSASLSVDGTTCASAAVVEDVPFFTVRSASGENRLEWVNPAMPAYGSTMIRFSTTAFPVSPDDGTQLSDDGAAGAGAYDSVVHGGLSNGDTYYYTAFVKAQGAASAGRSAAGRPFDTTGSAKWAYSTGATAMAPVGIWPGAIGAGGVFAVSNDRVAHAMNPGAAGGEWPRSGAYSWMPKVMNAPVQHRPAVALIAGQMREYIASQDGTMRCLDGYTGSELWAWSSATGEALQAGPAALLNVYSPTAPDVLFVGTRESTGPNRIIGLDPYTGVEKPAYAFANEVADGGDGSEIGIITSVLVDYATNRVVFTSRQAGSRNTVWCLEDLTNDGDMELLWAADAGAVDGLAILTNGTVYVGNNGGEVVAIDAATGVEKWRFATNDGAIKRFIWPHFGASFLYFSTDGNVWALEDTGSTATERWPQIAVPSPSNPMLLWGTNSLMVGGGDGTLREIDVTSGAVAASLSLGTSKLGSPSYDGVNQMLQIGSTEGVIYGVSAPLQ